MSVLNLAEAADSSSHARVLVSGLSDGIPSTQGPTCAGFSVLRLHVRLIPVVGASRAGEIADFRVRFYQPTQPVSVQHVLLEER